MIETYEEMRIRQQQEYNKFTIGCVFFAYSKEQFKSGMQSIGLKPSEKDKIFNFEKGAFILKSKLEEQTKLFKKFIEERQQAIDNDKDGTGFIATMFLYELNNHECGYTGNIHPALDTLDLTIDEIRTNPKLLNGLKIALIKIFGKALSEVGYIDK